MIVLLLLRLLSEAGGCGTPAVAQAIDSGRWAWHSCCCSGCGFRQVGVALLLLLRLWIPAGGRGTPAVAQAVESGRWAWYSWDSSMMEVCCCRHPGCPPAIISSPPFGLIKNER